MRKDLGKQPAVFPMPVLMVAAYDGKGDGPGYECGVGHDLRDG